MEESNGKIGMEKPVIQLQIGITDYCNLRCRFCVQGIQKKFRAGQKGFMEFSLWKKIIDSMRENGEDYSILLIWIGESLLHPQFFKMVEYLYKNGGDNFKSMIFYTNMTLFTKKLGKSLLNLVKKYKKRMDIVFSFLGDTPQTVKKLNGCNNFFHILENIIFFTKLSFPFPQELLGIDYQYVITAENFQETHSFLKRWSTFLESNGQKYVIITDYNQINWEDSKYKLSLLPEGNDDEKEVEKNRKLYQTTLKRLGIFSEEKKAISEKNQKKRSLASSSFRKQGGKEELKCSSPWEFYVVNWDGKVTACCKDFWMELSYGDFSKESFQEIKNKPLLKKLKRALWENKLNEFPKCQSCPGLKGRWGSREQIKKFFGVD